MYAVVYGSEWDDIAYFSDETSAYYSLFLNTLGAFRCASMNVWPEMQAYVASGNGSMKLSWKACIDLESIERLLDSKSVADVCEDVNQAIEASTKTLVEGI